MPTHTLADIAAILNCPAPSDPGRAVTGIATLVDAGPGDLSFLGSEKYLADFQATRALAVIVQKKVELPPAHGKAVFVVDNADLAVARVLEQFAPPVPRPPAGQHPTAFVSPTASVGEGARIGPNVVVGDDCRIGRNVVLHAGVVIGPDVTLGDDCELFPNVVVRERITIGNRVIIHAGAVLGTDGFGYRWDGKQHVKVPQIGTIVIEDDVEIGSCACVDRAKFSATRVGRGTKIDNLAQVGHNTVIGPHCIITGQVGLAGSVKLGAGVMLGGQSAVRDHVSMGDRSAATGCSAVIDDVPPGTVVSGLFAVPHRQALREMAAIRRLPDLAVQLRKLQEQVDELRKAK